MGQVAILPGDGKQGRRAALPGCGSSQQSRGHGAKPVWWPRAVFMHLQWLCVIKYELHLTHCLQEVISLLSSEKSLEGKGQTLPLVSCYLKQRSVQFLYFVAIACHLPWFLTHMLIPAWLLKFLPPQLLPADCTEMKEELLCENPFESGMGVVGTNTCSAIGLEQPTQKPGVPSTVKTRIKNTNPAGGNLYFIHEDEGQFPRVQEKQSLTTHSYQALK